MCPRLCAIRDPTPSEPVDHQHGFAGPATVACQESRGESGCARLEAGPVSSNTSTEMSQSATATNL